MTPASAVRRRRPSDRPGRAYENAPKFVNFGAFRHRPGIWSERQDLNLTLVQLLAGQIGGEAVIASGTGTTVTVVIPPGSPSARQ